MFNLKQNVKGRYKVIHDQATDTLADPHLHVIAGKHAEVYYHGDKSGVVLLGVDIKDTLSGVRHNKLVALLESIGAKQHNAYIYLITPDMLDTLAKPLGLPRVRVLSPEHRARLVESAKRNFFKPIRNGSNGPKKTPNKPPEELR